MIGETNYKKYLKKVIADGKRGIVKLLAESAGCQRSYLSQALSTHVNLTADHLCGIASFLNLKEIELDYLLLLLEKEKTSSELYRRHINNKLEKIIQKNTRISKRIKNEKAKVNKKYYSAWYYMAVHIATSINHLKSISDFANYLGLGKNTISKVLRDLEEWDLVHFTNNEWNYNSNKSLHLEDLSFENRMNHLNWRNQGLSRPLDSSKDIHYTSVFSISQKDYSLLREQILTFIEAKRETVSESGAEELVSFCCDFFPVNTKMN